MPYLIRYQENIRLGDNLHLNKTYKNMKMIEWKKERKTDNENDSLC